MRVLDTSVLARLFLDDESPQREIAEAVLSGRVLLMPTILLELSWVLKSRGGWPHDAISAALIGLLTLPLADCRDEKQVRWALARYAEGADFADMLHLALSGTADSFATFDQGIARFADASVVPVETLAA